MPWCTSDGKMVHCACFRLCPDSFRADSSPSTRAGSPPRPPRVTLAIRGPLHVVLGRLPFGPTVAWLIFVCGLDICYFGGRGGSEGHGGSSERWGRSPSCTNQTMAPRTPREQFRVVKLERKTKQGVQRNTETNKSTTHNRCPWVCGRDRAGLDLQSRRRQRRRRRRRPHAMPPQTDDRQCTAVNPSKRRLAAADRMSSEAGIKGTA